MSSYTVEAGAVKFGDAAGSYASLHVGRTRDLALVLQLRTFASEGLLMLLPVCLILLLFLEISCIFSAPYVSYITRCPEFFIIIRFPALSV